MLFLRRKTQHNKNAFWTELWTYENALLILESDVIPTSFLSRWEMFVELDWRLLVWMAEGLYSK